MTVMTQIILAVALVLSIIVPFGYYFIGEKSRGRYKTTIATNAFFFFGTMLVAAMVMFEALLYRLQQALMQVLQQVLDILQQLLLQVFPVLVVVLP